MSSRNQTPSSQQSQEEDLAFHPGIWRGQSSQPDQDDASVTSSAGQQHVGQRNNHVGHHVQAPTNMLPARPPVNNMLPARPSPASNVVAHRPPPGLRPPPGFTGQNQGFTAQHHQGFTGQQQSFTGHQQGFAGQNQGFAGQHQGFVGQQQGFSGHQQGFTGQNQSTTGFTGQRYGSNSYAGQPSQQGYNAMGGAPEPMNNFGQHHSHQTQFGRQTPRQVQGFTQTPQPASGYYQQLQHNNNVRQHRNVDRAAYPPPRAAVQANGEGQQAGGVMLYDPNFNFSDNYRGSRSHQNRSANVQDQDNCSVFIRGLPPTCTPNMLLKNIRRCGSKVWALYINAPDQQNPYHCAAKLVFFQRCGVNWLFDEIRAGRFTVTDDDGNMYSPNAVYNNIRSAPMDPNDIRSRVVVVAGPPSIVTLNEMDAFFKADFFYEADTAFTTHDQGNWRVVEFHFSSTRCQSENAYQALHRLRTQGPGTFAP